MVARKSVTREQMAERHFPVRVRVAVPAGGFGHQYNVMTGWLEQQIGKNNYWQASARGVGAADAVYFYFLTVDAAKAFVDRFACGLGVRGEWPETWDYYGGSGYWTRA